MFARKLNSTIQPPHPYKLRNHRGDTVTHPSEILKIFSNFYQDLLASPSSLPGLASKSWLENMSLPSLSEEKIKLRTIIASLKPSKAPGSDGFSSTYYKKCSNQLVPHLKSLYNHILKGHTFPDDMLMANMSLIPKPHGPT